jgi:hypothetical protein
MPQERWSWPRTVLRAPARRSGPAHLAALRFTTDLGDEVQILNAGPGDATDIVFGLLRRDLAGEEDHRSGSLSHLGAGNRYIVSLRPDDRQLDPHGAGCWLRLRWQDATGEPKESWAFRYWDGRLGGPLTPTDEPPSTHIQRAP